MSVEESDLDLDAAVGVNVWSVYLFPPRRRACFTLATAGEGGRTEQPSRKERIGCRLDLLLVESWDNAALACITSGPCGSRARGEPGTPPHHPISPISPPSCLTTCAIPSISLRQALRSE